MAQYGYWHIDIFPWMNWKAETVTVSGTISRINLSTALGMGYLYCNPGSVQKYVTWDTALTAGTWTLTLIYRSSNDFGVVTPSIDGSDLATLDCYNASTTGNLVQQWAGINVPSDGVVELKLRVDSKNASSSNYRSQYQLINFTRTA